MALPQSAYKDREFLAVIGDEVRDHHEPHTKPSVKARRSLTAIAWQDSVTGILLAGVGVSAANRVVPKDYKG